MKRHNCKLPIIIFLLLNFFVTSLYAETIYTKKGDIYTGTILSQTKEEVVILDVDKGRIKLKKTEIKRIGYKKSDDEGEINRRNALRKKEDPEEIKRREQELKKAAKEEEQKREELRRKEEERKQEEQKREELRRKEEERKQEEQKREELRRKEEERKQEEQKREEAERIKEKERSFSSSESGSGDVNSFISFCDRKYAGILPFPCSFQHSVGNETSGNFIGAIKTVFVLGILDVYFSRQISERGYSLNGPEILFNTSPTTTDLIPVWNYGYIGPSNINWIKVPNARPIAWDNDVDRKREARDAKVRLLNNMGAGLLAAIVLDGTFMLVNRYLFHKSFSAEGKNSEFKIVPFYNPIETSVARSRTGERPGISFQIRVSL